MGFHIEADQGDVGIRNVRLKLGRDAKAAVRADGDVSWPRRLIADQRLRACGLP